MSSARMHLEPSEISNFSKWLANCGADVMSPLNEWEIMRVRASGTTLVAFVNKRGRQTWPEPLIRYRQMLKSAKHPQLGEPETPFTGNKRARLMVLGDRDGWECWYCAHPITPANRARIDGEKLPTVEEVCPRQIGGPKHVGNQVVACFECNNEAANKSVAEKVLMRESKRAAND